MGQRDSSATRVIPVFDALAASYGSGLLALVGVTPKTGQPEEAWWGEEKALRPPIELLKYLVSEPSPKGKGSLGSGQRTRELRQKLLDGDRSTIDQALALLEGPNLPLSAWYILEGPSYPDVYVQTSEFILIVEGKRTERKATSCTTWMETRDQMLRHIDCAWEIKGARKVYGLLIVEGDGGADAVEVPAVWQRWAEDVRRGPVLDDSLPHRDEAERRAIADAIVGVTTWQRVCKEFRIDFASLPDFCD